MNDSDNNELLIINLATVPAERILIPVLHKCVAVVRNLKQLFIKVIATISLFFISIFSFGQRLQDTLLKELKPFDLGSAGSLRLLAGNYTVSNGMGGSTYRLDSIGTFDRVDFSDMGERSVTEKGKVNLNSNRQVEFVSDKGHLTFNLFVFDTFAFLVNPAKVRDFQRDFTTAASSFGKKLVYKLGDETYTAKFMIAFNLHHKYLVKGLK